MSKETNVRDELEDIDRAGWKAVKWTFIAAAVVATLSALAWVAHAVFWPVAQTQDAIERTLSADNAIYNYEWFHSRAADFDAAMAQAQARDAAYHEFLRNAGPRSSWDINTQREERQLATECAGLDQQVVQIAAEYNAHVGMANRNLFRERSLPEHLTPHTPETR